MPSEVEKAYAAGFFDGEGHICISYTSGNPKSLKSKYPRYSMKVQVGQASRGPVEWLQRIFGGTAVKKKMYKSSYNDRYIYPRWDWTLSTNQAADFLRQIIPYLTLKKEEAEIALSFQNSMMITGRAKLPQNIIDFRKKCFEEIRYVRKKRKDL